MLNVVLHIAPILIRLTLSLSLTHTHTYTHAHAHTHARTHSFKGKDEEIWHGLKKEVLLAWVVRRNFMSKF